MKKKNLILFIILAVLVIALIIIYFVDNRKVKKITEFRNFAVEDTTSINKIFLASMNNESVLLERHNGYWTANEKYIARRDLIDILLQTIKRVEVRERVRENQIKSVMTNIAAAGTKIEIYQNNKLVKTYYVGNDSAGSFGTFMILEGSEVPFVTHIPGFNGYLSIRYVPEINEWRERIIFNYNAKDMSKITVEQNNEPEQSFIINSFGNNKYSLTDLNGNNVDFPVDTLTIKEYILKIKYLGFEAYLDENLHNEKLDSVINEPFITKFTIEDKFGKSKTLKTYLRQNIGGLLNDEAEPYEWDIDNLYGIIDNKEIVILQYYTIDPINYKKSYFSLRN
jgi:hypothetical protein